MNFDLGWLQGVGPLGILGLIVIGTCYLMHQLLQGPIPTGFRYACLYVTVLLAIIFLSALVFMGIPQASSNSGPTLQLPGGSGHSEYRSLPGSG